MKLILMGPPGSGKGTLSDMIKEKFGWCHVSVGEILRERAARDEKIKAFLATGQLFPDEMIIPLISDRLKMPDCNKGVMLDGFPRTVPQADALQKASPPDLVIFLDCPDDVIVRRISSRWECKKCGAIYGLNVSPKKPGVCDKCGGPLYQRDDDKPASVLTRLKVYREKTLPVVNFYKKLGLVKEIDGSGTPEEVVNAAVKILKMH